MTYQTVGRSDGWLWRYQWDRYTKEIRLGFREHMRGHAAEQLPWLVERINASGFFQRGGCCSLSDNGRDLVFALGEEDVFRMAYAIGKPPELQGMTLQTFPYQVRRDFEAAVTQGLHENQKRALLNVLDAVSLKNEGHALLNLIRDNLPPEGDLGKHGQSMAASGGSSPSQRDEAAAEPMVFTAAIGKRLPIVPHAPDHTPKTPILSGR